MENKNYKTKRKGYRNSNYMGGNIHFKITQSSTTGERYQRDICFILKTGTWQWLWELWTSRSVARGRCLSLWVRGISHTLIYDTPEDPGMEQRVLCCVIDLDQDASMCLGILKSWKSAITGNDPLDNLEPQNLGYVRMRQRTCSLCLVTWLLHAYIGWYVKIKI